MDVVLEFDPIAQGDMMIVSQAMDILNILDMMDEMREDHTLLQWRCKFINLGY